MPVPRVPRIAAFALLSALLVAGCTGPESPGLTAPATDGISTTTDDVGLAGVSGAPGPAGGSVSNSAPSVTAFTQSATTGENRGGFVVVFSGTVKDPNAEAQIKEVAIATTGPATLGSTREITPDDRTATSEPAAFGSDGWKVWTGTRNDGVLNYQYQHAFAAFSPAGTYVFTLTVKDAPGTSGASAPLSVILTAFSDITIDPTPVNAAGAALTGANWGEWTAEAGARNVAATNYLKLVNTGAAPTTTIVIDLASAFVGATDPEFSIPVEGNVQFAWFEDTTPGATAPSEGTFAYGDANADGSTTLRFTGPGNVIYVTYRIVALPEILPVQSYGISFTATEL